MAMGAMRKAIQYLGFDVSDHEDYDYAEDELAPVTSVAALLKLLRPRTSSHFSKFTNP